MNYGQFLYMIPEATLVAILVIVFIADFISHDKADRKWFNPFVCVLMLAQLFINICPRRPQRVSLEACIRPLLLPA